MRSVALAVLVAAGAAQKCVNQTLEQDPFFLPTPTRGNASYAAAAAPWKSASCCNDNYTQVFQTYAVAIGCCDTISWLTRTGSESPIYCSKGVEGLYNGWSWNQCYNPSTYVAGRGLAARFR